MTTLPHLESIAGGLHGAPWVTFIPGIGNDASFWQRQADAVSDQLRTLRFDPWGCRQSESAPLSLTIDTAVDGIVALWDSLGIERSSVVGLGFGGSTALYLAIRHPDRVERVVACCCRPRQPDDRRQFWRDRQVFVRERGIDALADMTIERWLRPETREAYPEVAAQLRNGIMHTSVEGYCAYAAAFAVMDFENRLSELTAPTLLIAAEHDHGGGPVDAMEAMCGALPNARLSVIADCGHICNHEHPEQVNALLREYLLSR
jgi:3-oxoadipate enol-lactonase